MKRRALRSERGSALPALLIAVVVCGALSAAVLTTNSSRGRAAAAELTNQRAFEMAEAGADWGLSQIRGRNGIVPTTGTTRSIDNTGSFQVSYLAGNTDGADTDGDGTVDNSGEASYSVILSTGISGNAARTIQVIVRRAVETPAFSGAVQINVDSPIVDLSGNAFTINGGEHFIDGTADASRAAKYGLASLADPSVIAGQIPSGQEDQVTGLGGEPSITQATAIDMDHIVNQVMGAANVLIEPGTHSNLVAGTPTSTGVVAAFCGGDLHLSGNASGAGILVVDGDLVLSGSFTWVGIVLVRGRVDLTGGGGEVHIIGALTVGEEISDSGTISVSGTADLFYSTDAIVMASEAFSTTAVMSWREVANPTP